MKRFFNILAIGLICTAISCPQIDARGRNNGNNNEGGGRQQTTTTSRSDRNNRPQNSSRPQNNNNGTSRPQNNNNGNNRPQGNNNGNNRPQNNNSGNNRPQNNNNGRPQGNNNGNNRPQNNNNGRPQGNNNGNNRPQNNNNGRPQGNPGHNIRPERPNHPSYVPNYAPSRPMLPHPVHYCPPAPPRHFRPGPQAPRFSTILGITLGSAINISLNHLINAGYYVGGYTNNAVYLYDVPMLNMMWPNSTLYYNNGRLYGSEFVYASPYYSPDRYFSTFNALQRNYGAPVSQANLAGGGMQASWFGYDGRYVSLQFNAGVGQDGQTRYYTTLSFGN